MTSVIGDDARFAGYAPGIEPRLVVPEAVAAPLDLMAERAMGTYGLRCGDVLAELAAANLRGRGGAAFPAHVKWSEVARRPGPKVVVANGEEGEPASRKDRWLLTHRPHLVLDGLLLAAATVGATRAVVYLSHADTVRAIGSALDELRSAGEIPPGCQLDVHVVEPTYVAGEETAACRAIDGGPALPVAKPPRPFESGVSGLPTLVTNVETLAHAAWICRNGAVQYRRYGTASCPGTTLVTLSGACARPGVYEIPFGMSLNALFDQVAEGFTTAPKGFVMGGWFGGLLAAGRDDLPCCPDALREAGTSLGCAAITLLGQADEPVAVAAEIAAWYARESARQCGVCVRGTAAIRDTLARLRDGTADVDSRDNLRRWGTSLPKRGACALLDGAANWARTVVTELATQADDRIAANTVRTD